MRTPVSVAIGETRPTNILGRTVCAVAITIKLRVTEALVGSAHAVIEIGEAKIAKVLPGAIETRPVTVINLGIAKSLNRSVGSIVEIVECGVAQ